MKKKLVVVILTLNESVHIARAVNNVIGWADQVMVLDSYSTDDTVDIAKTLGAEVLLRKFDNYKIQREYAIEYYKDKAEWVFFLDADEYLLEELKLEINEAINSPDVQGYYMARRLIFMGKWIKWGGYYPTYLLRLFRPEKASLLREINEHIYVEGNTKKLKHDFIHDDLKDISHWIDKHNRYATSEAEDFLSIKKEVCSSNHYDWTLQSERKRWVREKVWDKLPVLIRPFIYFLYRYFIRLGILDGKKGFIYHFLQGLWCKFLIDVKCLELKKVIMNGDLIMSEDAIVFHNDNVWLFQSRYETSKVFIERYQVWLKFLKQYIAADSKVLDLGCGTGVFSFFLNEYCSEVIGIDGAEKMIALCNAKKSSCELEKVNFYQEKFPMAIIPQTYMNCDAIISSSVLEYIEELDVVISQVNLMLKSDGLFIFSMPNAEGFYRKLEKISFRCFSYPKYYRFVKTIISLHHLNTVMNRLGFAYVDSDFYGSMLPYRVRNLLANNRSCDLYIAIYRKITDVKDII